MLDTSSDSCGERSLLQETACVYEKYRWVKVTFNSQTKRILDPPLDFELLQTKLR